MQKSTETDKKTDKKTHHHHHHHDDNKDRDKKREERREKHKHKDHSKDKDKKHKKHSKDKEPEPVPVPVKTPPPVVKTPPPVVKPAESEITELGGTTEPIELHYDIGKQLGSGAFSVVKEGSNKKTKQKVAIKIIKKETVEGDDIKLLRREVHNLKTLDHPHILKLYEVYESKNEFFLVMELVEGKELFDKIVERGQYSEKDASNITRQIISAIDYLHSKGIAHRDLKPENLLSVGTGDHEVIKVADFGLSKNFGDEKMMTSCGSPGYVAPEVLECETYDKAVDMWSIGVILYILLVGYPPFYADNDPALFKKIMACDYDFGEGWDVISNTAKDLVKNLLVKDPKKRLTASQSLNHPFIKGADTLGTKQLQMHKLKDYVSRKVVK